MRAIGKRSISFGVVSVPVRIYTATEDHDIAPHPPALPAALGGRQTDAMLTTIHAFSGLGVDDIDAARHFYGGKLGLAVTEDMGGLRLALPGGTELFVYPSPAFTPAGYTALNFVVPDIEAAAAELTAAGIELERYDGMGQDELGIMRGKAIGQGPDIAWFRDPAGNTLSIIQS